MYLDPGFGGMLIQILIAVVAAGGAAVFAMRKKLRAMFSKKPAEIPPKSTASAVDNKSGEEAEVIDMMSSDN